VVYRSLFLANTTIPLQAYFDARRTPLLDFGHRLALTFFLECIALVAKRDHRIGFMEDLADASVTPLDTGLGAPLGALRVACGRWRNKGGLAASSKSSPSFLGELLANALLAKHYARVKP
jgi:hypothetical protein